MMLNIKSKKGLIIFFVMLSLGSMISCGRLSDDRTNESEQESSWPMFKQNAQHTGQSEFKGSQTGTYKWGYETENSILFLSGNGLGTDGGDDGGDCEDSNDNGICDDEENFEELVVINEINYNPALSYDQEDADYEFIELYNNSPMMLI